MQAIVVVPTYNERATLERAVMRSLDAVGDLDVLIVDDSSPDGTGELADALCRAHARVHVLHRPGKSGLGPAYRAGLGWALERDYDAICEMDADLSHDPADLARLVAALEGADLVIGSRYVPGGRVVDWSPHRLALSSGGNRYVRLMTGLPVADATSGFRAFRRVVLTEVGLATVHSDGYAFQLEMALRTWRTGFRVVEIPITFTERSEGASKINWRIIIEAVLRTAHWGLEGPRRPAGVHARSIAAHR
ncbi:MAG: glycosyltransferase [Nitriliruptorales bacterium]|nr:glycosyltransferase [Nitriliruptorales bacterium]